MSYVIGKLVIIGDNSEGTDHYIIPFKTEVSKRVVDFCKGYKVDDIVYCIKIIKIIEK